MPDVEVTRVAASSADKATSYASEHDIPAIEEGYAELVASDAVDLVYNALPPSGHRRWSIAALENGKHVLCEKPFALNAGEAAEMAAAAEGSSGLLIEAFHYRFHPLFERVMDIVRSGTLGSIRRLEAHFDVHIPYRPGELRHTPAVGGGALMDLGCYPVHWLRTIMQSEPEVISAEAIEERE
ncbi:MAG: Gfo/Idh/MocA family oxidoreductase, partial [Pseudomonadota bacterium]